MKLIASILFILSWIGCSVVPASSFKVFPGDIITGNVSAYFTGTSGYTAATASTMATALSAVLAGGTAAIDGGITTAYTTTGNPLIALGGFGGSTFPSGYLNYILFDENYVPIKAKSFPVQNLPSTKHTVQFDQPLEVKELGYLFVYLSYDNNQSSHYLYFDDLKVIVDESPLIQVNNYYPFGMVANTWLREGEQQNAKLFQGKELIAQTGWHDFGSRMYWADLGRWFAADPQKQFSSPYLAMGNGPVNMVDPDGELAWFVPMIFGALVGGTTQGTITMANGGDFFEGFWKGAVTGIVGGGLANFGGGSFLADVLWGTGAGAITGGVNAALWGTDIGDGMLNGAAWGAAFAGLNSTIESIKNAKGGYGFGTNDGRFNKMVKDAIYEDYDVGSPVDPLNPEGKWEPGKLVPAVSDEMAKKAFDFWKKRYGGPSMTASNKSYSHHDPNTGAIGISKESFFQGPRVVRYDMAHETGHYVGKITGERYTESTAGLYEGDGYLGYRYAIEKSGHFGTGLKTLWGDHGRYVRDAWLRYSEYTGKPGVLRLFYAIRRRF